VRVENGHCVIAGTIGAEDAPFLPAPRASQ
jgi:hypothetical protein